MIFNSDDKSLNFARKRVTDIKGNSRVILPKKVKNFDLEARLEMFRTECMGTFKQFMSENCGKYGKQKSNLTKAQLKGLKSLKTRIENAEIVVLPTDKTGNFAIMTCETYLKSGMKHTRGDIEVGWECLEEAQREVNGHVSMLLKIFHMGEYWNHEDRIRETMLSNGMTVCPISLLYKDHKGWTNKDNSIPPTRHVAGGHVGLNLYLSEVVSEISEPMVGTLKDGAEVISGEDLIANVDILNEGMAGWHVGWTWEGVTEGNLISCGTCEGSDGDLDDQPEVCKCEENIKDTCDVGMETETSMGMERDLDTCEDSMLHNLGEELRTKLMISNEKLQKDGMLRDEYDEYNKDTCEQFKGTVGLETNSSMEQRRVDTCSEELRTKLKISNVKLQEDGMLHDEYDECNKDTCNVATKGTIELETSSGMEQSMVDTCNEIKGTLEGMHDNDKMTPRGEVKGTLQQETKLPNQKYRVRSEVTREFKGTADEKNDSPKIRVTRNYMKKVREEAWKSSMEWNDDPDRMVCSREVTPERLQDYETKMVIVGTDVISLYPNLEIDKVIENMKEAVLGSSMVFQEVDYMEAVRYLALNWDAETCRRSHLRRILPTRRGRRGNRPGVKGPGPRGKVKGDQEQWLFPPVVLTEKEKREGIAEVVALATKAMFNHHYYRFGGKTFHQVQGGPIGLRGTCAVARIVMQLFDAKWKRRLQELGITTWLISRYVDDSRAILQPIRPGWRWVDNDLRYTKKWEQEDKDIPGEIRTRDILVETMTGIESYLAFTAETESDFKDGWLPTLDTS